MEGPRSPSASQSASQDADMDDVTPRDRLSPSPSPSSSSSCPSTTRSSSPSSSRQPSPVPLTSPAPALQALNTSAAMPPSLFDGQTALPPPVPHFSQLALAADTSDPPPVTSSPAAPQDALAAAAEDVGMANDGAPAAVDAPGAHPSTSRPATPRSTTPRPAAGPAAAGPSKAASTSGPPQYVDAAEAGWVDVNDGAPDAQVTPRTPRHSSHSATPRARVPRSRSATP